MSFGSLVPGDIAARPLTRARVENADAYAAYLDDSSVRELSATPGNEHLLVLRARYFPEDERDLLEMTPDVVRHEVPVEEH